MGLITTVILTVLLCHEEAAKAIFTLSPERKSPNSYFFAHYVFYDVDYGDLPFLDALESAGIPFDSSWDSAAEYCAGYESCRFTSDGGVIRKTVSNDDRNPPIDELMKRINVYAALKDFIKKHHDETSIPVWDNQEQYAKIYRAKQLIAPI